MKSNSRIGIIAAVLALLALLIFVLSPFSSFDGEQDETLDPLLENARASTIASAGSSAEAANRQLLEEVEGTEDELGGKKSSPQSEAELLQGHVWDEERNGIENAWVATWNELAPVRTNSSGAYSIPLKGMLDRGHPRVISAWAEGREFQVIQVFEQGPADITLGKAQNRILRILRRGDDVAIQGAVAKIMLRGTPDPKENFFNQAPWVEVPMNLSESDINGEIQLSNIPSAYVHVTAPGFAESVDFLNDTPVEWRLYLSPEKSCRVRFLNLEGIPLSHATVSFDPSMNLISTDADGWVEVPAMAILNYNSLAVQWEDRGFVFANYLRTTPPKIENGKEIMVPFRELKGALHVIGDGKADDFEITTCALRYHVGDRRMPDPVRFAESVEWFPIASDGTFTLNSGWQGLTTQFHVRRKSDGILLLSQKLSGDGPYDLTLELAAGNKVTFKFTCDPIEALAGARLKLRAYHYPRPKAPLPPFALKNGEATDLLTPGDWSIQLTGPAFPHEPLIGRIQMPDEEATFEFNLGKLHTLKGKLTADGKPFAARRLDISIADGYVPDPSEPENDLRGRDQLTGFFFSHRVGPDGIWEIPWVPEAELKARVETENNWLQLGSSFSWTIPAGEEFSNLELPVGTVEFSNASGEPLSLAEIRVSRKELEGDGGRRIEAERVSRYRIPDLSNGPVTIPVSPSQIRLFLHQPMRILLPSEVEVQEGEHVSVELRVVDAGEVVAIWQDEEGRYRGEITLQPLSAEIEHPQAAFFVSKEFSSRKGGFLKAHSALPGKWRFTLKGPILPADNISPRNGIPYGTAEDSWSIDVDVIAGKKTIVKVGLDENGEIHLTQ